MARVAAGDRDAFGVFYDRHGARVLGLLLKLLRHRTTADDVLQETFLQVWRSAGTYDAGRAGVTAWLAIIARSRARDRIRRERRAGATLAAMPDPGMAAGEPRESSAALESAEAGHQTQGALAALPEEQRQMICLSFFGGLSHAEIAERTALPLGTIKTRIRLGIRRMREILDGQQKVSA